MFTQTHFVPAHYDGPKRGSPVRHASDRYCRMRAEDFADKPAKLTPRQAHFYHDLIALALAVDAKDLPVDFITAAGDLMYLDRGCIKIAEQAGFIAPLQNDGHGVVDQITLTWQVKIDNQNTAATNG